jgi:hypothetical protein
LSSPPPTILKLSIVLYCIISGKTTKIKSNQKNLVKSGGKAGRSLGNKLLPPRNLGKILIYLNHYNIRT